MFSSRLVKSEDPTHTDSSATDDQEKATDGEKQSNNTDRRSNSEISFSHRPKGAKFTGLESLLSRG